MQNQLVIIGPSFGLAPTQLQVAPVQPMQSAETSLQVSFHPSMFGQSNPCNVAQIALKNNTGVYYFQVREIKVVSDHL